ncbi:FHA/TonB domain protein [Plesiocystis pacifica SIR-1]|uniref:FHA/TonB domain protein n=1 Tax=Plesiocystis pacifica SIR-1 TaxID=391625 RepID=A6G0P7_9BACT|nr:FHA/TonB domain protein [Plesiocystis pacifica SIR-1]
MALGLLLALGCVAPEAERVAAGGDGVEPERDDEPREGAGEVPIGGPSPTGAKDADESEQLAGIELGPTGREEDVLALFDRGLASQLPVRGTDEGATLDLRLGDKLGKGETKARAKIRLLEPTIVGSLDAAIINRVVRAHLNELRYCYELALREDPQLRGALRLDFTIDAEGKVSKATVGEENLGDETVLNCLGRRPKHWQFPEPRGGGEVEVGYPIKLSPG